MRKKSIKIGTLSLVVILCLLLCSWSIPNGTTVEVSSIDGKRIIEELSYVPSQEIIELFGEKDARIVIYEDGTEEIVFRIPVDN